MAGPQKNCERFIVSLLSLTACSFDGAGLGQTGEASTSGEAAESTVAAPTTGAPGGPTTDEPTSVGPAGEMGEMGEVSETTGPTPTDTTTGTSEPVSTMTSADDSSSSSSTGCEPLTFYADVDGDGFGDADKTTLACEAPAGHVDDDTDCDDADGGSNPAAKEQCDNADNDCDGVKDDFDPTSNKDCGGCKMLLYPQNNRVYLFCSGVKKWADAAIECDKRDAKLAKDIDDEHHAWLLAQLPNASGPWWLGATSPDKDDEFIWTIDDSEVPGGDDPRWSGLHPLGGKDDRIVLVSLGNFDVLWTPHNGKWFDREDKDSQPFICERAYAP